MEQKFDEALKSTGIVFRTDLFCVAKQLGSCHIGASSRTSVFSVPGSEKELECCLLLIAAGFVGCESAVPERFGLRADGRGRLMPEDQSHFLGGKLFSAGDMRTGQSLVVRALADGRAAAVEADRFLNRKKSMYFDCIGP